MARRASTRKVRQRNPRDRVLPTRPAWATGPQVLQGLAQAQQLYGPTMQGPAPAAGSAPSTFGPQALPIDPIHTGQTGLLEKRRQDLLAQTGYQTGQLASEYGFLPGTQTVDPNNPYSRASLLQRSYHQGQAGTTNSMASRGQLYSGATQRGLDEGTFNYSRNSDALQKSYQGGLNALEQQKTQGLFDLDQSQLDADADRIDRAPDPVPGNINYKDLAKLIASEKKWTPKQIQQTTAQSWSSAARKRRRSAR